MTVRVTNNGFNPSNDSSMSSSQVGFTYYDAFNGRDTGVPTPSGATLTADPPTWTGDDLRRLSENTHGGT